MTLRALFPVTQQFQNKNGSNLVGGKVYIYYQGRTALATTYHDQEGTVVNPNPVLLDNNGRAAVFADTIYSYTIVVCDYYGKELFSQDITLHDAISTAEKVMVMGSNGTIKVDTTTLPNGVQYDLSVFTDIIATKESVDEVKTDLNTLTGTVNNHTTQIGQIQEDINGIESTVVNKKDKQNELNFNGSATKTVKSITQNANGELNVEFADIDLPQEVPNVEITSEDKSIKVSETTDVQTNTKKFDLSVQDSGTTYSAGDAIDLTNDTISVKYGKGLEITKDNKLQLKVGQGLTLGNDTLELTIKDLATSITDFRTGDVIAVDGPSGTAKMSKDDLLKESAENTLSSIKSIGSDATDADLKAGNYFALDGVEGTKRLPAESVAKASELGYSKTEEVALDSFNYSIIRHTGKPGDKITLDFNADKPVNLVVQDIGHPVHPAQILMKRKTSGTYVYTLIGSSASFGFYVYNAGTHATLSLYSGVIGAEFNDSKRIDNLDNEVGALPILTRKSGTLSVAKYGVYKGPVNIGDVITLDVTANKKINVFAVVDGNTAILIEKKKEGTTTYTIPEGFQSIGIFPYDGETDYVLDIVTGIGNNIVASKNTLKNITSTKLTSNLLNGFCSQEDFTLLDMRDVGSYVKGLQGSVSTIHDIEGDYTRIYIPSGTSLTGFYKQVAVKDLYTKYDVNGKAEVYFSADMKNTENFVGLYVLTNNSWSSPNTRLRNVSDSFGRVTTHIVVSGGTPGASVRFTLKAFFTTNSAVTLDSDLIVDIKNAILSLTPINEIGSYDNVNNRKSTFGKNLLILGDSISTGSYYSKYLPSLLQLNNMYNVAVSGASICDRSTTSGYDGNPTSSVAAGNVLGNQVQKVINNPSDYTDVDIILISAGTNDGTPTAEENTTDGVESFFTSNDGADVINCTEPTFDSSDTYQTSRKHFAGALRYIVSKLESLYPNAKIFLSTPIQGGIELRKTPIIQLKQQIVNKIAERLSVNVLRTGECCGILQDFEYGGYYWDSSQATESHPRNGRDLIDALHPNENGSKKIAEYIANQIEKTIS